MTPALINGWERSMQAAEKVRARLQRATTVLEAHGVPYAVIGGNAIGEWVGRVDESAVRNTQDVDLLLNRSDFEQARQWLESVGFCHCRAAGIEMFLDGPHAKARDALHVIFANEKVRPEYEALAPGVDESEPAVAFRVLSLAPLVRMKLTSWRDKDRMHLRDLISVGLINADWPIRFPPPLADRLQQLLDSPDG